MVFDFRMCGHRVHMLYNCIFQFARRRKAFRASARTPEDRECGVGSSKHSPWSERKIVEQFDDLPRAHLPDVDEWVRVGFENRAAPLHDIGGTTGHDQQSPMRRRHIGSLDATGQCRYRPEDS